MSPEVTRSDPPYIQIVRHIRGQIVSGELKAGDRLPSTRQIMRDWSVAMATASRVISSLRAEGLVVAVPGVGTVVSGTESIQTSRDRAMSMRRTGRIYPPGERARITVAELVEAPEQVVDALGIEAGAPVIRRHRVTYRGEDPIMASVSWFDGALVEVAPLLLGTGRIVQGTPAYIEETTGRVLVSGRDQFRAAAATEQEAADLGVETGAPVLKGRNWLYDNQGTVIEYGESVASETRWTSYDYTIAQAD